MSATRRGRHRTPRTPLHARLPHDAVTRARTLAAIHLRTAPARDDSTPEDVRPSLPMRHIRPRHAALAAAGSVTLVLVGAGALWWTAPEGSHQLGNDPAVAALRTYEAALDGNTAAARDRDARQDRYTITRDSSASHIGTRSPRTGTCWVLTIPNDTTKPTSIDRSTNPTRCAATAGATPSGSTTTPTNPDPSGTKSADPMVTRPLPATPSGGGSRN